MCEFLKGGSRGWIYICYPTSFSSLTPEHKMEHVAHRLTIWAPVQATLTCRGPENCWSGLSNTNCGMKLIQGKARDMVDGFDCTCKLRGGGTADWVCGWRGLLKREVGYRVVWG